MTHPATPPGGTAAARSLQPHVGQRHSFLNTPTGLSTADSDGGCEGRAAFYVNAGRTSGASHHPAKLANVAIFQTDADRARTIPRPFAAPFDVSSFHSLGLADA